MLEDQVIFDSLTTSCLKPKQTNKTDINRLCLHPSAACRVYSMWICFLGGYRVWPNLQHLTMLSIRYQPKERQAIAITLVEYFGWERLVRRARPRAFERFLMGLNLVDDAGWYAQSPDTPGSFQRGQTLWGRLLNRKQDQHMWNRISQWRSRTYRYLTSVIKLRIQMRRAMRQSQQNLCPHQDASISGCAMFGDVLGPIEGIFFSRPLHDCHLVVGEISTHPCP